MALCISTVFRGIADIWLHLQAKYDLQTAAKKVKQMKLTPYKPGRPA
jgi:plasmid maintenance system antidote protein VapI